MAIEYIIKKDEKKKEKNVDAMGTNANAVERRLLKIKRDFLFVDSCNSELKGRLRFKFVNL